MKMPKIWHVNHSNLSARCAKPKLVIAFKKQKDDSILSNKLCKPQFCPQIPKLSIFLLGEVKGTVTKQILAEAASKT